MKLAACAMGLIIVLSGFGAPEGSEDTNPAYWQTHRRKLAFVPDESDGFAIDLKCLGNQRLQIVVPLGDMEEAAAIQLSSGALTREYAAVVTEDEIMGRFAEGEASVSDPLMAHFRKTGQLSLPGAEAIDAKTPKERRAIERFFAACH